MKQALPFKLRSLLLLFVISSILTLAACEERAVKTVTSTGKPNVAEQALNKDSLEAQVSLMAAIGYVAHPSFSPDGQRVAYITAHEGVPQVWIADAQGNDRTPLTPFSDQVTDAQWRPRTGPDAEELAVLVAPGGGLNSQVYRASLNTSEPLMITEGGKVNNWLTR
jgi:dipeptidyl aminopeptidase/acylaminoacyl peptidase